MTRPRNYPFAREDTPFLIRERDLAKRWSVSTRTLQRWRVEGFGPAWLWIGGSIRYRMSDILAYEAQGLRGRPDQ